MRIQRIMNQLQRKFILKKREILSVGKKMNVKLASSLAVVIMMVIGGAILLLRIPEKERPANEFTSISELWGAPENYENKIVKVKGSITMITGFFEVEDNTGKISISYTEKGLPYNIGENVVVTVELAYLLPLSSIWPPGNHVIVHIINIENTGEKQPPGVMEIDEVLEILENIRKSEQGRITAAIQGTISDISTNCYVSDNTGGIWCYSSESFPYKERENVAIEGEFIVYINPGNYFPRIHMQRVERAR